MAAISTITINDGAATPVAHAFTPQSTGPAVYRNGSSPFSSSGLAFDESLKVAVKPNPTGLSKVSVMLQLPHYLTVPSGESNRDFDQVEVNFTFAPASTEQRRKDARVLMANILTNSQLIDAIEKLNEPY